MAAKNLEQAILLANLDIEMKKALCVGPLYELVGRIRLAEKLIVENLQFQLRDYLAHRVMILGENATALDLFKDVCGHIPAFKGDKNDNESN